jgi:hypothetical protein
MRTLGATRLIASLAVRVISAPAPVAFRLIVSSALIEISPPGLVAFRLRETVELILVEADVILIVEPRLFPGTAILIVLFASIFIKPSDVPTILLFNPVFNVVAHTTPALYEVIDPPTPFGWNESPFACIFI